MGQRRSIFYGWVMVGISIASLTLVYGIRHSFSVFFPSILDEFSWSRASTSLMLSLNVLVYGFMAPVAGRLGDRWNPKKVMVIGVLFLSLITAGCSLAANLWHFWVLFGLMMPLGTALAGWPLIGPALSNWFTDRRGLVMGLSQCGIGLSFVYGIISELAIERLGWRHAYFVLAGLLVAVLLPLYLFFFHFRPASKGLAAYGSKEVSPCLGTEIGKAGSHTEGRNWTLSSALRTYQLWLLICSNFFFWGVGDYLVLAHQIRFAEDVGFTRLFASSVFVLFGISMLAGQLSAFISDLIGRELTITIASVLSITAVASLITVSDASRPWALYLYASFLGYGTGVYTPTIWAAAGDIFHGKNYGAISNLLLTGMGVGGAIGPWLGGYFYDIFGSYKGAFVLSMVAYGIACVTVLIAAPRKAGMINARG